MNNIVKISIKILKIIGYIIGVVAGLIAIYDFANEFRLIKSFIRIF